MSAGLSDSVINGRFKLLERPYVLPGKCAVCGSVERAVVDFGLDIDGYGTVYICTECLIAACSLLPEVVAPNGQNPAVPSLVDIEAVNEYIHGANDSIQRLDFILNYIGVPRVVNVPSVEPLPDVIGDPESIPEPSLFDIIEDSNVPVSEGPVSVPASRSNEPNSGVLGF